MKSAGSSIRRTTTRAGTRHRRDHRRSRCTRPRAAPNIIASPHNSSNSRQRHHSIRLSWAAVMVGISSSKLRRRLSHRSAPITTSRLRSLSVRQARTCFRSRLRVCLARLKLRNTARIKATGKHSKARFSPNRRLRRASDRPRLIHNHSNNMDSNHKLLHRSR